MFILQVSHCCYYVYITGESLLLLCLYYRSVIVVIMFILQVSHCCYYVYITGESLLLLCLYYR